MSDIHETALLKYEEEQDQLHRENYGVVSTTQEYKDALRILSEKSWRAGYDVLTEGALGDYPE